MRLTFSESSCSAASCRAPATRSTARSCCARSGRLGLSRPERERRPHPQPAREARGASGGAEPDPDRPRPGLPIPGGMIRAALRGLRGRLLLSFVATSAVTLVGRRRNQIGPLQSRLRAESATTLQEATEATRPDFENAMDKTANRSKAIEKKPKDEGGGYDAAEADRRARRVSELSKLAGSCASGPTAPGCSSPTTASATSRAWSPRRSSTTPTSPRTSVRCGSRKLVYARQGIGDHRLVRSAGLSTADLYARQGIGDHRLVRSAGLSAADLLSSSDTSLVGSHSGV